MLSSDVVLFDPTDGTSGGHLLSFESKNISQRNGSMTLEISKKLELLRWNGFHMCESFYALSGRPSRSSFCHSGGNGMVSVGCETFHALSSVLVFQVTNLLSERWQSNDLLQCESFNALLGHPSGSTSCHSSGSWMVFVQFEFNHALASYNSGRISYYSGESWMVFHQCNPALFLRWETAWT